MSHFATKSCITVHKSYKPGASAAKYGTVSLQPSGGSRGSKIKVPITDATNPEQLLDEVVSYILKAATNAGTREDDFEKFMQLALTPDAQNMWDEATDGSTVVHNARVDGDYRRVLKIFLDKITSTSFMRDAILRNAECRLKKPYDMTPNEFKTTFLSILRKADFFDGIKPAPTDQEKKQWFVQAFPEGHQVDYAKKGTFNTDTLDAICEHMSLIHRKDVADGTIAAITAKKEGGKKPKASTKDKDVTTEERGIDRRRRRGGGGKQGGGRQQEQQRKRLDLRDDAPCPLHGPGHTWGECRARKKKDDDTSEADKKRKHSDKSKTGTSHHIQAEAEASSSSDESDSDSSTEESSNKRLRNEEDIANLSLSDVPDAFADE